LIAPSSPYISDTVFQLTECSLNGIGGLMYHLFFLQPPVEKSGKVIREPFQLFLGERKDLTLPHSVRMNFSWVWCPFLMYRPRCFILSHFRSRSSMASKKTFQHDELAER